MHLVFLPAYSPDLNPIELAFLCIKVWLHANHDHMNQEMEVENSSVYNTMWQAVYSATPEKAQGWHKHCRYQQHA